MRTFFKVCFAVVGIMALSCSTPDKKKENEQEQKLLYRSFSEWPTQKFSGKWTEYPIITTHSGTRIFIQPEYFIHTNKQPAGDSMFCEVIEINKVDSLWKYGILTESTIGQPLSFLGTFHLNFRDENGPLFLLIGKTIPVEMTIQSSAPKSNLRTYTGSHDSRYAVVYQKPKSYPWNADLIIQDKEFSIEGLDPLVKELSRAWISEFPDTTFKGMIWMEVREDGSVGYIQTSGVPSMNAEEILYAYLKQRVSCTALSPEATQGGFVKLTLNWNPQNTNKPLKIETEGISNFQKKVFPWKDKPLVSDSLVTRHYIASLGWNAIGTSYLPDGWQQSESTIRKDSTGMRINQLWPKWNMVLDVKNKSIK